MIIDTLKMNCGNCKYWQNGSSDKGRCLAALGPDEHDDYFKKGTELSCVDGSRYFAALLTPKTHSCAEYERDTEGN